MRVSPITLILAISLLAATSAFATKTNPTRLYMHYMPWFESPETLGNGQWGWHWEMNTRDPDVILPNGQRQIASHYYPLIGPYASSDPDVIEYHLHLMRLSGIDGILIDWYGVQGTNGDINQLLNNANALINQIDDFGLEFAVVLEDRFAANTSQVAANVAYLRDNYFNQPNYIRDPQSNEPLLPVFGPITVENPSDWTQILQQAGENVDLLPLWYQSNDAGPNADGEYAWIFENEANDDFLPRLQDFYANRASSLGVTGAVAYPGFDDFYLEGGVGDIIGFEIPYENGQTLDQTLALAQQHASNIDFIQLATWNDFGEGTMLEPTDERGFDDLVTLQQFSGVTYDQSQLEMVLALFEARKASPDSFRIQQALDAVSTALIEDRFDDAALLLQLINDPASLGDANADVAVNLIDLSILASRFGLSGQTGADGDFNGDTIVDLIDLSILATNFGLDANPAIPEPAAATLLATAALTTRRTRPRIP